MSFWKLMLRDNVLASAFFVCVSSIIVFGLWSALAPIEEGVVAYGKISVPDERIVVQHLEGGLIEDLRVQEGEFVQAGDTLMTLTNRSAIAKKNQLALRLAAAQANLDRVEALISGSQELQSDTIDAFEIPSADRENIQAQQEDLFTKQKVMFDSAISQVRRRSAGARQRIESLSTEISLEQESLSKVESELVLKKGLFEKRLVSRDLVIRLEREQSEHLSRIASLRTRITEATSSAAEADLEIKRITAEFLEGLGSERLEYQQQIAELQEELAAAADVMDRSVLTAPETGAVINLKFRTDDGVVGPGEPILEIVPSDSTFYAILELNPQDRDSISEGMNVEVRLSGIDSWRIRPIQAKVIGISADLKQSGDAGYTYYEVKAVMSKPSEHGLDPQLMPGMPVEVFLPSGQAKTLLGYLAEPVTAIMRRGMRE